MRFVSASSPQLLAERFGVSEIGIEEREPDYNVTPRALVPAVRERPRDDPPTRVLTLLRWGLVPSWAKSLAIGDKQINARAESVAERPAYHRAFRKRRCIIPADAFYEWKATDEPQTGRRLRAYPTRCAAATASRSPSRGSGRFGVIRVSRVTTIQTRGSERVRSSRRVQIDLLAPIHERMPVVLAEDAWDTWLDPSVDDVATLERLLAPAPDEWFTVYEVSTRVNKPENNDADLLTAVSP